MANVKYLENALAFFKEHEIRSSSTGGAMVVSIITILKALKEYEVGIPQEYFEFGGCCMGIERWLCDEVKKRKLILVSSDNTYDMVGDVSIDFGFAQFDSLVSEDTFVFMHVHDGCPFYGSAVGHNNYPAMLFRFKKGVSFYDVLDDITFENPEVPSMMVQVYDKHYLVLPRIISESYYVKCLETEEELGGFFFVGSEEDVKSQIKSCLGMRKALCV